VSSRYKPVSVEVSPSSALETLISDSEGIGEELRGWFENLPESLQGGDKGSALEEAASSIENAVSNLQSVDPSELDRILGTKIPTQREIPPDPEKVEVPTEEETTLTIDLSLRPGKKRGQESRAVRLSNASAHGSAIVSALEGWSGDARSWIDSIREAYPEVPEGERDGLENHREAIENHVRDLLVMLDEAEELLSNIEDPVGEIDGVEIPGMYG